MAIKFAELFYYNICHVTLDLIVLEVMSVRV